VLTADTFGSVKSELAEIPATLSILTVDNQDKGKLEYVQNLGTASTVSIGNGRNDRLMLDASILGIAVIQGEGACTETLSAADVVCQDILAALNLLINPQRLVATLRL
jgi:soluble P-type ATPase